MQLVIAEVVLCISEDLTSSLDFAKGRMDIARHNGSVINQGQESTSMFCKDDLLLSALDGSREVVIVSLLEFLTSLEQRLAA